MSNRLAVSHFLGVKCDSTEEAHFITVMIQSINQSINF